VETFSELPDCIGAAQADINKTLTSTIEKAKAEGTESKEKKQKR